MIKCIKLIIIAVSFLWLASCDSSGILGLSSDLSGCWAGSNNVPFRLTREIDNSRKIYKISDPRSNEIIGNLEVFEGNQVSGTMSGSTGKGKIVNSQLIELTDKDSIRSMVKTTCPDSPTPSPTSNTSSNSNNTYTTATTAPSSSATVENSLILVEGGTFQMGDTSPLSSYARPVHSVTLSSFYMGKYEVTQKEYQTVIGSNSSNFKGDNLPVETVSWFDVIKYCNALSSKEGLAVAYNVTSGDLLDSSGAVTTDVTKVKGYRLPTEAEWEYAARGGNKSKGYEYSGSNTPGDVGWSDSNSGRTTHQVGTKTANELGLYDMSGNVYEWAQDWFAPYGSSAVTNPNPNPYMGSRVLRGGSWYFSADFGLVSTRLYSDPSRRDVSSVGFRVVRSAP